MFSSHVGLVPSTSLLGCLNGHPPCALACWPICGWAGSLDWAACGPLQPTAVRRLALLAASRAAAGSSRALAAASTRAAADRAAGRRACACLAARAAVAAALQHLRDRAGCLIQSGSARRPPSLPNRPSGRAGPLRPQHLSPPVAAHRAAPAYRADAPAYSTPPPAVS